MVSTGTYARIELGACLAVEEEHIRSFNCRSTIDERLSWAIRKCSHRQPSNETQLAHCWLSTSKSANVQCVDTGSNDVIMSLKIKLLVNMLEAPIKRRPDNGACFDGDYGDAISHARRDGRRA